MRIIFVLIFAMFSSLALSDDSIIIYAQKDIKSEVVEKVDNDENLLVIFIDGNWSKVEDSSNGKAGWIINTSGD
ncbi:hypothetical protein NGM67_02505 [Photobacterium damselae]|uniref:hypothetical protein n=1 Tax=Photobacterium damselae TaxID=38293 RepID=UPI00209109D4|nr:hypothetical protein [Photobacterium damselae]USR75900.1 hypothetical protein NGM67_02505 [Photobacterium damselae]